MLNDHDSNANASSQITAVDVADVNDVAWIYLKSCGKRINC